jgi:prepilin-type N-terminal cleavage/methylation domain-containing protein
MKKGVTLLETLIVLFLAGIIMPFLFKMISTTFEVVDTELRNRQGLKEDLTFVLENDKKYIKDLSSSSSSSTHNYFIKEGMIVKRLVILGEGK